MSVKRSHQNAMDDETKNATASTSPFIPMFEQFRAELDEHHDRRERVIKASRDITAASKKVIFTLQRVRTLQAPLPPSVVKDNEPYADTISAKFASISRDLQGLNGYRYARQISGGCQEWVEAASFEHYLTTASILSYDEAVAKLKSLDAGGPGVELSHEDYLLGIYDMTGELMRFAITAMATSGALPSINATPNPSGTGSEDVMDVAESDTTPRTLLTDMRDLRSALESLECGSGPFAKEVEKKMIVMRQSVEKVERALYGLIVRGAERPKGWMPDTEAPAPDITVES